MYQWSNFDFCWTVIPKICHTIISLIYILLEEGLSCLWNLYLVHWIWVMQSHLEAVAEQEQFNVCQALYHCWWLSQTLNRLWMSLAFTVVIYSCNFLWNWIGTNCTNYKYFVSIVIFTNSILTLVLSSEPQRICKDFSMNCLSLVLLFLNTLLSEFQILYRETKRSINMDLFVSVRAHLC